MFLSKSTKKITFVTVFLLSIGAYSQSYNTEIEANETDEILIIEEQIENYQSQKLVA